MADRISQVLHATSTIRCRRTTARLTAVFGLCVALAPHPSAGEQGNGSPAFEVASIKPTTAESPLGRGVFTFPGGRVVANGCTLEKLIEEAFRVDPYQVSGGPRWIRDDRYDVEAKPPESSGVSKLNPASAKTPLSQEPRQMLQTLLADRFHLVAHHEVTEGRVFLLAKGTSELKLRPARNKQEYPWVGGISGGAIVGDGVAGTNATTEEIARRLSSYLEHPVLDRTGLSGSFDFEYDYRSGDSQPDLVASIVASIQALGLKLESAKGPIETLVIEHVEKPTAN